MPYCYKYLALALEGTCPSTSSNFLHMKSRVAVAKLGAPTSLVCVGVRVVNARVPWLGFTWFTDYGGVRNVVAGDGGQIP